MIQSILIGAVLVVALWLWSKLSKKSAENAPSGEQEVAGPEVGGGARYPGVSIRTYRNGCPAAEALKGQRFLPDDAPPLPLPDCIWARCNCTYSHHVDRRTGNIDRRKMMGEDRDYPLSVGDEDQRGDRGRRLRDSEKSTS